MKTVAVLFARSDSIYYSFPECDVYNISRNALCYDGSLPIIAHPPCRSWGRLKHFAKPRENEKSLAPWAIEMVRKFGGIVEHPSGSSLWKFMSLPTGRNIDEFNGFTVSLDQFWFGHKARKRTLLYICGCAPSLLPAQPLCFDAIRYICGSSSKSSGNYRPEISKREREETPVDFAQWLINTAVLCSRSHITTPARSL